MGDPTEWTAEEKRGRQEQQTGEIITHSLESLLLRMGMRLGAVKFKFGGGSVLLILTVPASAEGPLILFCGGRDAGHCLRKAYSQIKNESAKWKSDEYVLKKLLEAED